MVKSPKSNVIYNELYLTYEELKRFFDKEFCCKKYCTLPMRNWIIKQRCELNVRNTGIRYPSETRWESLENMPEIFDSYTKVCIWGKYYRIKIEGVERRIRPSYWYTNGVCHHLSFGFGKVYKEGTNRYRAVNF